MSDERELADIVERAIDMYFSADEVSPAWVATYAMTMIEFPRSLHRLGYAGCHMELKQIARGKLRRRFDPTVADDDGDDVDMDDLFPETLQERYPKARKRGEEPVYCRLNVLTEADIQYNIERMRRSGAALYAHAERLEKWWRERSATA